MKKARLVIAMVIVAMMTSMFSFASAEAAIVVTADKTEVSVGDVVTVSYAIPEGMQLTALDIKATWDETKLKFVGIPLNEDDEIDSVFGIAIPYGEENNGGAGAACSQTGVKPAKAGTVFTAKFEVIATDAKVSAEVVEASEPVEEKPAKKTTTKKSTKKAE